MLLRVVLVLAGLGAGGCTSRPAPSLTLATTTSVQDSGLLEELLPRFRQSTGIEVKVVAVGSGQALELGRRGDADVILAHDPEAEQRFMDEGSGSLRRPVMHNDLVVVGPRADPAGVRGAKSAGEALARIARAEAPFVSRGDESGTHRKERAVWERARVEPRGDWYVRAGAGMGAVLRMADQKRGYTLTDRATFLAAGPELVVLFEGDPLLVNRYSVILVSPEKHPHVRSEEGRRLVDFLTGPEGQEAITAFGRERFGRSLFVAGEP
jgi:tungstate transport system substrate-binding protein